MLLSLMLAHPYLHHSVHHPCMGPVLQDYSGSIMYYSIILYAAILCPISAEGMKALRKHNIVHRDLKPGNILIKHHPHTKKMQVRE